MGEPDRYEDIPRGDHEDRFADGFLEGFVRARQLFWRDLMRRAGECRTMLQSSDSEELKQHLAAMEAAYRNSADLVARSHTLYPGSLPKGADPNDPRFGVNFDDNLFRY